MKLSKIKNFDNAVELFPKELKDKIISISDDIKENTWEIRVRNNLPIMFVGSYGKRFLCKDSKLSYLNSENTIKCSMIEINNIFNKVCGYSIHTHQRDICNGFITIEGGHRVGFCGTAVMNYEKIDTLKDINSINLRIARQHFGTSQEIFQRIYGEGLKSIIIVGAPLSGKTTILRDLARNLSSHMGQYNNVSIIDERNEIAATSKGMIFNDLGLCCDILSGYPKAEGIIIALRTLSPDLIICDEIGNIEEVRAIKYGLNSGVKFIISVHAENKKEVFMRPQILELINTKAFDAIVLLEGRSNPGKIKEIIEMSDLDNEIFNNRRFINYKRVDGISV